MKRDSESSSNIKCENSLLKEKVGNGRDMT